MTTTTGSLTGAPQSLGAVLANVSILQKQTRSLEKEIASVNQEVVFAQDELQRALSVLADGQAEFHKVQQIIKDLATWRSEHTCAASEKDYDLLMAKTKLAKSVTFRVEEKEEHVQAILLATRNLMTEVEELRRRTTDPGEYIATLQQKVDQQELNIGDFQRASDEFSHLESESAALEAEIRRLRAKIELAGVPVPEAPQTHRIKRIVSRATTSEVRHTTRLLRLPVGALRTLSAKLGRSIRDVAQEHGIALAVEIQDVETRLHLSGAPTAMSEFEKTVMTAMQFVQAELMSGGLITCASRALEDARSEAAEKLMHVLHPAHYSQPRADHSGQEGRANDDVTVVEHVH